MNVMAKGEMMGKMICVWILMLFAISSFAQIVVIKDKLTHQPLALVSIYSRHPSVSISTDARGHADLSEFTGADSIRIELVGYKPAIFSYMQLEEMQFVVFLEQVPFLMNEVVVSATRWEQYASDLPNTVLTIRPAEVALHNPQTAADLLDVSGGVFIQKSQLGGGSPMIRGFATNRVLIAVDGVRMNNAIFRSGNLQNVISLDPLATEKTEVIFGPGSVIYGSDAIGGVMSFYTPLARFSNGDQPLVRANALTRTSSADFEKTGHVDLALGFKKWALVSSATFSDYDDLVMGSHGPDEYLRPEYARTVEGHDMIVENPDPKTQVSSGYYQMNLMQKIGFKPNDQWGVNYGFHYSTTSDYPRYDRLVRYRKGVLRSAEWYYGPQVWMMNALNLSHSASGGWYDRLNATAAYQYFRESRHDRDFNADVKFHRTETVDVYSANLDFEKSINERHLLFYGAELVLNRVGSSGEDENIATGLTVPGSTRYPDGATWNSYAGYLNYHFKAGPKVTLQSGMRYNWVTLNAKFDTTFYPFPFTEANINTGAFNGSIGMAYKPQESWQINVNLSSGFRAPNVDDVGKVFDSESGAVVVPNPDLEPEYAFNAEAGIDKIFGELLKVDIAGYYTLLENALVRRDFTLNGLDSTLYDGELSRVQAIQNAANANVHGFQAGIEIKLPQGFALTSRFNYQKGEEELDDGSSAPLRHAGPWFGSTRLTCARSRFRAIFYAVYNGEISNANLAPSEREKDYIYAIDENGNPYSPAWYTLNLKTIYHLTEMLTLSAGMENITDQRYRPYSSGIVAPGRNYIATLRVTF
jgi:hemoglobin/transferrin/lactoferrin receptor protein